MNDHNKLEEVGYYLASFVFFALAVVVLNVGYGCGTKTVDVPSHAHRLIEGRK